MLMILRLSRLGHLSRMARNSDVSSSSNSAVQLWSTYQNQSLFSLDLGISQLDHLHARWMHRQATTRGLYCRHIIVRWRLLVAMKYDVWARSLLALTS